MTISTVGQQALALKGMEDMKKDHMQRIYTNQYLQLAGVRNIWGGGDACHVIHPITHQACPTNALWAINHGRHAGRNIACVIRNKEPKPFQYRGLGQCASLGIGKGMGEIFGIVFTGWAAWIMRWIFFVYFMPSRRVMWKAVQDWLHLLLKGRRIDLPSGRIFIEEGWNPSKKQKFNPFQFPMEV
jgi:NADH dehydrogenase